MINFLSFHKNYVFFALFAFASQPIIPSHQKKERPMGWGTMIFGRNTDSESLEDSESDDGQETLPCTNGKKGQGSTQADSSKQKPWQIKITDAATASAKQRPEEIEKDSPSLSSCKNNDGFEMIDEPISPNFLQSQPIPKQSNPFLQSTIGIRESYLDYMRRIILTGQQEDAMTKDANYGVNASRALFDSVQKLTELNSAQDLSAIELLKSHRASIVSTHGDCDMLIQAVNQRCSFCQSKLTNQAPEASKNQVTACTGCTYGKKHITPKHIEDGQKALRAAQVAHLNQVAKLLKNANDRQEAIHQLRVELYKAHPTPEQTRAVSPLHRMELIPNPNKNN
ncbi:MAG: hypothetical protein NTU89_00110 [Candidatus Dependentiae bacterium]|nr:hypothetical protein [Candidatus Dependentiae bacterium]